MAAPAARPPTSGAWSWSAFAIQLLDNVSAAAHKARGLLDQSFLSTLVVDVRLHEEPAHMGLCQLY